MSDDSLIKPTSAANGGWAHNTEVTLPDGVRLVIDWNKSEMTINMNGRKIDISAKSTRVVVGRELESNDT